VPEGLPGQTLRELSKSRASLSQAQYLAQIGSWEWDVKNDVLHWSEAVFNIFAIDPLGFDKTYHSFLNSVHPQDKQTVQAAFDSALTTHKQFGIDHQIVLSKRVTRYVHTEAKVIDDGTGSPLWMTGTVQDITERKQYEEQIRKLAYFDSLTGLPKWRC
jgi:two-component system, cell cycle sensor histidine kinase and response regulator CckA